MFSEHLLSSGESAGGYDGVNKIQCLLAVCSNLKQKPRVSSLHDPKPGRRHSAVLPFCEMGILRIGRWNLCFPYGNTY